MRTEGTYNLHYNRENRYVQNPDNSQNFNRYSYCLNNPLKYTDPSGWVMVGGMTPYVSIENWGVSYYRPVHGPSTLTNAYNMLNIALYGNLYGPQYLVDGGGGVGTTSGTASGTYGYYVTHQANSVYNYTFASTKLQLIRNWQYNPSYRSNSDLRGAGITNVTVGVVRYGNGYQKSYYTYTVSGRTYSKVALDYVGRSKMDYYGMSIQPLEKYGDSPVAPEMHMIHSQMFTYDGTVHLNPSRHIQVDAGQHVKVEIKNINAVGVIMNIQDVTTYHYTKTLLGFPKIEYTGEGHRFGLLPGHSVSYDFYRYDYAPIDWLFEINTSSDVASVRIRFYSEWHNGMSPDPNHPKY